MLALSAAIVLTDDLFLRTAVVCVCTLVTELIGMKTHPRLPIPSPIDWPWGRPLGEMSCYLPAHLT